MPRIVHRMKKPLIVLAIVIAALVAEFAREHFMFTREARRLQRAYWSLDEGRRRPMTREQAREIAGSPDRVEQVSTGEQWTWFAHQRRGLLLRALGAGGSAAHYRLFVDFDKGGFLIDVVSETE